MPLKYKEVSDSLESMIKSGQYPLKSKLPTEKELAQSYNVSRQTIRQALSLLVGKGIIEKRQGSGNTVVSSGTKEYGRCIAVMISYTTDYIFPNILNDIQRVLMQNNYSFKVFATNNNVSLEREALREIISYPFAGLLAEGVKTALPNPNLDFYRELKKKKIPFVFLHGGYAELGDAVCVTDDSFAGCYKLTRHLISKGHSGIGGIFNSDDIQGRRRYQGYITALLDAHLPVPEDKLLWFSTEDRHAIIDNCDMSLLINYIKNRLNDCTAVIAYNDEIAYRFIPLLQKYGGAKTSVTVASFDNSYYCGLCTVPVTSLRLENRETGAVAASLLVKAINGEAVCSVSIPWKLIEYKSK